MEDNLDIVAIKCKLVQDFARLNKQAMDDALKYGCDSEMLNAIRENIKFLFTGLDELRYSLREFPC